MRRNSLKTFTLGIDVSWMIGSQGAVHSWHSERVSSDHLSRIFITSVFYFIYFQEEMSCQFNVRTLNQTYTYNVHTLLHYHIAVTFFFWGGDIYLFLFKFLQQCTKAIIGFFLGGEAEKENIEGEKKFRRISEIKLVNLQEKTLRYSKITLISDFIMMKTKKLTILFFVRYFL